MPDTQKQEQNKLRWCKFGKAKVSCVAIHLFSVLLVVDIKASSAGVARAYWTAFSVMKLHVSIHTIKNNIYSTRTVKGTFRINYRNQVWHTRVSL
jgi:hypothetical protein